MSHKLLPFLSVVYVASRLVFHESAAFKPYLCIITPCSQGKVFYVVCLIELWGCEVLVVSDTVLLCRIIYFYSKGILLALRNSDSLVPSHSFFHLRGEKSVFVSYCM